MIGNRAGEGTRSVMVDAAGQTPRILLAQPSAMSLFIQMSFNGTPLATGTGFVVQAPRGPVLITNLHNVTGLNRDTGQPLSPTGGVPNEIRILHNIRDQIGTWGPFREALHDEHGTPKWREHPTLGKRADLVALPMTQLENVALYPYDPNDPGPDIVAGPADVISVIGFPFGLNAGGALAIWATGFVASEPDIDYNDLPIFLIDCRSRPGQSGSPVIAYRGEVRLQYALGLQCLQVRYFDSLAFIVAG